MPLLKVMLAAWGAGFALTHHVVSGFWFSERFSPGSFRALGVPVKDDANLDISSYETLAQGFLLLLLLRSAVDACV